MFNQEEMAAVKTVADEMDVELPVLLALTEVESGGVDWWDINGRQLPAIRFEGHYFHKLLTGSERAAAVQAGLAHPRRGGVKNPRSRAARYELYDRAKRLNHDVAIMSTSHGMGQVMGIHWERLGYSSPRALEAAARQSVAGQVRLMGLYISHFGLVGKLQRGDWHGFFRAYNGKLYKRYKYHIKFDRALKRWRKLVKDEPSAPSEAVKDIQRDLRSLGYWDHQVDGIETALLRSAVRRFQQEHGLNPDGKYGPLTDEEVQEGLERLKKKADENVVGVGIGVGGLGELGRQIVDGVKDIQIMLGSTISTVLEWGLTILTVGGVALIGWGIYNKWLSRRREEQESE